MDCVSCGGTVNHPFCKQCRPKAAEHNRALLTFGVIFFAALSFLATCAVFKNLGTISRLKRERDDAISHIREIEVMEQWGRREL